MFNISANRLPIPFGNGIGYASAVPYDNSFLLVGGYNGLVDGVGGDTSDVYQYIAETDEWVLLATKLETPRQRHVALLVEQSLFPECA